MQVSKPKGKQKQQHQQQKKRPQKFDIKALPEWTPDWAKSRLLLQWDLADVLRLSEATQFALYPDLVRIVLQYSVWDTETVLRSAGVLDEEGKIVEWPMGKKKKLRLYAQEYLVSKLKVGQVYTQELVTNLLLSWLVKGPKCVVDIVSLRRSMYSDTTMLGKDSSGPTYWRLDRKQLADTYSATYR